MAKRRSPIPKAIALKLASTNPASMCCDADTDAACMMLVCMYDDSKMVEIIEQVRECIAEGQDKIGSAGCADRGLTGMGSGSVW